MKTIDFEAMPIKVGGCWIGEFTGSAEIKLDCNGEAYVDTITVLQDIAGTPDLELRPPKPGESIVAADTVILWFWIEAAIRDQKAKEFIDLECDFAIAELGYGPMQHERH